MYRITKKNVCLLVLFFLGLTPAYADHIVGGEITYEHLSGNDYEVTLKVYRDCGGIPVSYTQLVNFRSVSCGQIFNVAIPYVTTNDVSQVCAGQTTTCNGGTVYGVQQYVFKDTVTLTPCVDWIMSANPNSRNSTIITNLNIPPIGADLYVENTLNSLVGVHNNSPQFLNIPTPYLGVNQLALYNQAASDVDGDSLYYQFNQPLSISLSTPIPFASGYSLLQPMLTTSGMNLNPFTGDLCFTPSQPQVAVVAMLISEYRNGTLIGTYIREIQIRVAPLPANQYPTTGIAPTCNGGLGSMTITVKGASVDSIDQNSIRMCPNDSLCMEIIFSDPDPLDSITVLDNIASAIPGASWNVINQNTPNPVGTFCWVPTPLDSGLNIFSLIVNDDACPVVGTQTFTYDITVFDQPYAGPDQTICKTETAQLNASGGSGYTWFYTATNTQVPVSSEFSCNPCQNPMVMPLTTTSYFVSSATPSAAGCSNTDTVEITVIPSGYALASTPNDTNICVGEVINFTTTPSVAGAYTYNWTSTLGNAITNPNDSTTNIVFNTTGSDTIIVYIQSATCLVKDTFLVYAGQIPNINITTADTLLDCVANVPLVVDLGTAPSPNNYAFDWNYPTTLDTADIQNPLATPNQGITNYAVVVTDTLGGCSDTDTVEVRSCCIVPTVTHQNISCFGLNDGKIIASATALNSNVTLAFHQNDMAFTLLQSSVGNAADSMVNLGAGSYIIMIFDSIGCSFSDTFLITEPSPVVLSNVTPDTTVCVDGTATLYGTGSGATAPIGLVWDNGLVGNGPHNAIPTNSPTIYTVYALDANNCASDTQFVSVTWKDSIKINNITLTQATVCKGESTTVVVNASGGGAGLIYTWLDGNGNTISTTDNNVLAITPNYDGEIFSVMVSDSCTTPAVTDSIVTDWSDVVFPTYTITDNEGCYDKINPVFVNTTVGLSNIDSVFWDFGDGNTYYSPFNAPITHNYVNPGTYEVKLTLIDQAGCVWDTIMPNSGVAAHDYPTADFMWLPNPTNYLNAQIEFNNLSVDNIFNEWLFITDAQYTSNVVDPIFQFPQNESGSYDVSLTITSAYGCRDSISKVVVIDDVFLFYIPKAFSPNGDDLNDTFYAVGEGLDSNAFSMLIFNRFGELIFESDNPSNGWDGTYKGQLVPSGVYVWKINVKEKHSPIIHEKEGFVTVLR